MPTPLLLLPRWDGGGEGEAPPPEGEPLWGMKGGAGAAAPRPRVHHVEKASSIVLLLVWSSRKGERGLSSFLNQYATRRPFSLFLSLRLLSPPMLSSPRSRGVEGGKSNPPELPSPPAHQTRLTRGS